MSKLKAFLAPAAVDHWLVDDQVRRPWEATLRLPWWSPRSGRFRRPDER